MARKSVAASSSTAAGGKRHRKRKTTSFAVYVFRILKQVHPDTGISRSGVDVIDQMLHDVLHKIVQEAHDIVLSNKAQTVNAAAVQTAVRLLLNGEVAKHAVNEGMKAVAKVSSAKKQGTRAAGLTINSGRVKRLMRHWLGQKTRIGGTAPVYLAAVLEYLAFEVLELSGNVARDHKRQRITPRHVLLTMENDPELRQLVSDATIRGGGVMPNINSALLPKRAKKQKTDN